MARTTKSGSVNLKTRPLSAIVSSPSKLEAKKHNLPLVEGVPKIKVIPNPEIKEESDDEEEFKFNKSFESDEDFDFDDDPDKPAEALDTNIVVDTIEMNGEKKNPLHNIQASQQLLITLHHSNFNGNIL
ncbi:MAG: hypothetical protein COC20_06980, partial [Cellvibrionales bacterium]